MAVKNSKAKKFAFPCFLAHLSLAWVGVCTCARFRNKIQHENCQPQKRLEHLLKEVFEPDAAALKGRKSACNFKKGVYFTAWVLNWTSESKQKKGTDSVLIYNSTRQLWSSCSLWSDICKTNKTHERGIRIRMQFSLRLPDTTKMLIWSKDIIDSLECMWKTVSDVLDNILALLESMRTSLKLQWVQDFINYIHQQHHSMISFWLTPFFIKILQL